MTFSTLRALHSIIGAAIDDIERIYHERSQGNALEYPSLDEPYYSTAEHTPEEELAETLKDDPVVVTASMRIVAACGQLAITVNRPWHGLVQNLLRAQFSSAIRFLEAANVVEILREAGPEGLHVRDIHRQIFELRTNMKNTTPEDASSLTPANLSSRALGHILRLLATGHYLREVKHDVFANNRASSYIDSGKNMSQLREAPEKKYDDTDGVAAFVSIPGDEIIKSTSCLTDWALPERRFSSRTSYSAPPPECQSKSAAQPAIAEGAVTQYLTPFNLAFNTQLSVFSWFELPGNEGRFVRFRHAVRGTRQYETKSQILQAFSWEELPKGSVLVDVGGGIGTQSILIAEAYPHIRVVVEDREQVVSTAVSAWGSQYAHLFKSGRMSWRTRDFFEAWPALSLPGIGSVGAPEIFLLRLILHDWNDEDCKRMLTRLGDAAGPHTKLLIGDLLLPHACADQSTDVPVMLDLVPSITKHSPLSPNLGVANIHGYLSDIMMLSLCGSQERTIDEVMALTRSAGWKIVNIRRTPCSIWAYSTAVPI